ncbi:MAG: hypothetical protein WKF84_22830 [Pyrinomonadaceae bacterium]
MRDKTGEKKRLMQDKERDRFVVLVMHRRTGVDKLEGDCLPDDQQSEPKAESSQRPSDRASKHKQCHTHRDRQAEFSNNKSFGISKSEIKVGPR